MLADFILSHQQLSSREIKREKLNYNELDTRSALIMYSSSAIKRQRKEARGDVEYPLRLSARKNFHGRSLRLNSTTE